MELKMDLYDLYLMIPKHYRHKLIMVGILFVMILLLLFFVGFYTGTQYGIELCNEGLNERMKDMICI